MTKYDDGICSRRTISFLLMCLNMCILTSFPIQTSVAVHHQLLTENILQSTDGIQNSSCGKVCTFDDWFRRAQCENNDLNYVPIPRGCEGAVMLELQGNRISLLTATSLVGYEHVKTLDLTGNLIVAILSGTFSRMNNLENILIGSNYIQEVANYTFTGAEGSLRRIYLNYNKIEVIWDNAFRGLGKVISIYLSYNQIFRLPESLFWDMHDLHSLYLGTNNLEYLSKNVFNGLIRLEVLTLDSNNLRWIPIGLFAGLESLREVKLSDNQLVTIPAPEPMGIQVNLELLDLRKNNLSKINEVVPYLMVSNQVRINGNPFGCNCSFTHLQERFLGMDDQLNNEEQSFVDQYQEGCFWNANLVSFKDYFIMECQVNDSSYLSINDFYSTTQTTSFETNTNDVTFPLKIPSSPTPLFDSRTVLLPRNASAFENCTRHRKQEITSIYCAIALTLFFLVWIAKTTFHFFSRTKGMDSSMI